MTRRTSSRILIALAIAGVVVAIGWLGHQSQRQRPPMAVAALQYLEPEQLAPVSEEIMAMNPLREAAGLAAIQAGWRMARCLMIICDGPSIAVLVDGSNQPVKVILTGLHVPHHRSPVWPPRQEYDLVDGRFLGRAAEWRGEPPTLYLTETYQGYQRNGMTTYFAADGTSICSCEYRADRPWTGRRLDRRGFELVWDVSYREGRQHGRSLHYGEGGWLRELSTYDHGVREGPQRSYSSQGTLVAEEILRDGERVSFKTWHADGRPASERYRDDSGHGAQRIWNESGSLVLERFELDGRSHGRSWEQGRHTVWFWRGKCLGTGTLGKERFEKKVRDRL